MAESVKQLNCVYCGSAYSLGSECPCPSNNAYLAFRRALWTAIGEALNAGVPAKDIHLVLTGAVYASEETWRYKADEIGPNP